VKYDSRRAHMGSGSRVNRAPTLLKGIEMSSRSSNDEHMGDIAARGFGFSDRRMGSGEPTRQKGTGKAVVLLSGGLDSATVLAMAKAEGLECHCLTVDYGQRHRVELEAAHRVASALEADSHRVVTVDLRAIGGSALTDNIRVPKNQDPGSGGTPITYVPARNTVFLGLLLAFAEVIGAADLFIGVNEVDFSGYPDCRPAFLEAFERLAEVATVAAAEDGIRFRVRAPLLEMSKAEIIRRGTALGVDYAATFSCYDPAMTGKACGRCDACQLRRRGFDEAGIADPTAYSGPGSSADTRRGC